MRALALLLACLAPGGRGRSSPTSSAQGQGAAEQHLAGLLLAFNGPAAGRHGQRWTSPVLLDRSIGPSKRSHQRRVPRTRREVLESGALAAAAAGSLAFARQLPAEAETAPLSAAEELAALQKQLAALQAEQAAALAPQPAPAPVVTMVPKEPAPAPAPVAVAAESLEPIVKKSKGGAPIVPVPQVAKSANDFRVIFRNEVEPMSRFMGPKATIITNVKYDDPETAGQLPELVRLHDIYASQGLHILAFPTNQGWFEPDEINALRLKFKRDFDFGKFPSAILFDKVDLLGTNASPFWNWLTKTLPNPWGVDRICFNYEKFLMSADGQPLRRYPRRYPPELMEADLNAVLAGQKLPQPFKRWDEEWERGKREAAKSEYAFRPGYNYYATGSPGDSGAY
mmetsp:Transcript_112872/g.205136  ORF Transcript_112872/g.205136 Transcript_112872/m.205136 type:complete len:397 (-) Transcript_112872:186-1376(-)